MNQDRKIPLKYTASLQWIKINKLLSPIESAVLKIIINQY